MKAIPCLALIFLSYTAVATRAAAPAFAFQNNDRVMLLGSTLIEREQKYGFLESQLDLALPDKTISVRNLGWSGDTVFGHARSYFGPPAEGLERLSKHFELIKPTVLIACYGADEPFEGLDTLPEFIAGYGALMDLARSKCPGLRIIIAAPPPFENLGAPLPDLSEPNARLAKVRDALKEFAAKQGAAFVDMYALMGGAKKEQPAEHPLTDDGLHYGKDGYRLWAEKFTLGLTLTPSPAKGPEFEALRKAVIEKDRLFFNRWRPQNETYLYGFRKHEQGKNAAEVDQFDPLVTAEEAKIAQLKSSALAERKLP